MKAKKWLCVVTALVMLLGITTFATACSDKNTVEVTWYNGRKELRVDKVKIGEKVTSWTPTRENYIFNGWFSDQTCDTPFDFTKAIEEDTAIYAGWRNAVVADDTRIWYAIGGGSGTLQICSGGAAWEFATEAEKNGNGEVIYDADGYATFKVKEGFEDLIFEAIEGEKNVYTLELTLYAGDKFRILTGAIGSDWSGDKSKAEIGLGNFEGFDYADGTNPNGNAEVTADEKTYGEVKNEDDEVVFYGGMENGNYSTHMWNAWLAEGKDGKYRFTITTFPGDDKNNTVMWELVEPIEALEETHKMFFTGSIYEKDKFENAPTEPIYLTQDKNNKDLWTAFLTIDDNDLLTAGAWGADNPQIDGTVAAVKVKNEIGGADYGVGAESGTAGTGNLLLTKGTWCITYVAKTNIVSYEKCDYYVVGTFLDGTEKVEFAVKGDITPKMTTTDDGVTYTAEVEVTDVTANPNYSWIKKEGGEDKIFALQVVFGTSLGVKDWYGGGNHYLTEAGTYTVTFTVNGGTVTEVKKA